MIARPPPPFSLVVDTVLQLTPADYKALAAAGYKARGGYLDVITPKELAVCLASGLGFFGIGYAHESNLIAQVKALGLPAGCVVYQDCESEAGPAESVIARINTCAASLAGYQPGLYIGAGGLMTSAELSNLAATTYGKGCSRVTDRYGNVAEPSRGFAWIQGRPWNVVIAGKTYDVGFVQNDYRDEMPSFVWGS